MKKLKINFVKVINKNSYKAQVALKEAFNQIDINGDGKLSFEEVGEMMKNIIKKE